VARIRRRSDRAHGFTLLELMAALSVIIVGLVALSGYLVSASGQREQVTLRHRVLAEAQNILEEIRATDPYAIRATYDGATFPVEGVQGVVAGGRTIAVAVDSSDPKLLTVTVTGRWRARGAEDSLTSRTQIFNRNG